MSKWLISKLGLTSTQFIDGDRSKKYPSRDEFLEYGVLFLNGESINSGTIRKEFANYILDKKYSEIKKGRINQGDILLTTRGNGLGDCAIVNISYRGLINAQMLILRPQNTEFDSYFLFYYLRSNGAKNMMKSMSSGSAQPQIPIRDLKFLSVPIPPISIQKKIAAVLSTYDDLIENNDRRIALLEKMAEEIYREWFVRLRFPGHEQVTFHKGILEGWEIKKFSEELNFKTGKLNSNAAVSNGRYPFFTCSNETFRTNTYSFDAEAVLLAGNNAAGVYPLKYYIGKFDAYQRTYVVTPKYEYLSVKFIYFMLRDRLEHLQTISIGAATQFLTLQMLNSLEFLKPHENLVIKFERNVAPIFKKKFLLKRANETLIKSRDRLLTRLISGKLSVEDLDIQFPSSMVAPDNDRKATETSG